MSKEDFASAVHNVMESRTLLAFVSALVGAGLVWIALDRSDSKHSGSTLLAAVVGMAAFWMILSIISTLPIVAIVAACALAAIVVVTIAS